MLIVRAAIVCCAMSESSTKATSNSKLCEMCEKCVFILNLVGYTI